MNRYGLLIANCNFPDCPSLSPLATPDNDVTALQNALKDRSKGGFELETVKNSKSNDLRLKIDSVMRLSAKNDGLALIYYSGHGTLDPSGRLYLATYDSRDDTYVLSVGVHEILTSVRQHGPRRVVILLDCCYSGAGGVEFELKGTAAPFLSEDLKGSGVVVMTATSPVERAVGDLRNGYGIFTRHVVQGINTGVGKRVRRTESDAYIPVSVNELFQYVQKKMQDENAPQTPHIWNIESTGDFVLCETRLRGAKERAAIAPARRWEVMRDEKRAVFDLVGPAYILDRAYHFLDWNTAFELLVARPLQLRRGTHVIEFLDKLNNRDEVFQRSNTVFLPGQDPLVDEEVLRYQSNKYGEITFHKLASQIPNLEGGSKAWSVQLNVVGVEMNQHQLWQDIAADLRKHAVWSKYADSYDKVISRFTAYQRLVNLLVSLVGSSLRCADLGAGTGNVTMRLLADQNGRSSGQRTVLAVEKNDSMLECLQRKLDLQPTLKRRTLLYKGDITTVLREQDSEGLDACVMLNVLFALENPSEALQEVFRVLKKGGILALSTSHKNTNIRLLFNAIKTDLAQKRLFTSDLEPIWLDAFNRNVDLEEMICRDSKQDIHDYVTQSGFRIDEYMDSEYVDCVVVYKLVKP
jgi:ubiquinone/menaquinone biosynthesis C-methylase UbiE